MNILAVIIGDYCSEYMPTWYCWLFQSPTALLVQVLTLAALVYVVRRTDALR